MMEFINLYYCNEQQRDKRGSLFSQQVLWVSFVIRSASELGLKRFFLCFFYSDNYSCVEPIFSCSSSMICFADVQDLLSIRQIPYLIANTVEKERIRRVVWKALHFLLSYDSSTAKTFLTANHHNLLS